MFAKSVPPYLNCDEEPAALLSGTPGALTNSTADCILLR
jgi:hypothetical protein